LWGMKWCRFWNRAEYDDMRLLPVFRLNGVAFGGFPWPGFEWFAVGGLWGLMILRHRGALRWMSLAGILGLTLFFITARYRLALVPLLAVLGAVACTRFAASMRNGKVSSRPRCMRLSACIVSLVISFGFAFWPLPRTDFRALDLYNTGAYWLSTGRASESLPFVERGLALEPSNPDMHFLAGNALFGLERFAEAASRYERAVAINPTFADAFYNLAVCRRRQGFVAEARTAAEQACRLDPEDAPFRALLAELRGLPDASGNR
jgi:tetratricopeptide (TPR) repeat protein